MLAIDLSKKIAVVTGGGSQLGRAMSVILAECGADVAVHYHKNREQAENTAAAIRKLGRRACVVQADVTDKASIGAMKKEIEKELGAPDIIVNNASVSDGSSWKPILEQTVESYEGQFRSCTVQNVLMAQAFAPAMIKKKWGRIIAINTECSMLCLPTQSNYASAKRAMDGLLRALAKEIGMHGITVNQVAPGWTISDRDRENKSEKQEHYDKDVPLRRRGTDREIAQAVAFLASDLASFITGLYLPVTGGNIMPTI
ncbi:MAG: SDR family oxidoreductase [Methylacidiphilales bacterium]|nr:SDR family oxidoreductase [Candidatus Methylacidiphilales bacterium]